jgi:DNA-binding HxlR family transcriptional regulator
MSGMDQLQLNRMENTPTPEPIPPPEKAFIKEIKENEPIGVEARSFNRNRTPDSIVTKAPELPSRPENAPDFRKELEESMLERGSRSLSAHNLSERLGNLQNPDDLKKILGEKVIDEKSPDGRSENMQTALSFLESRGLVKVLFDLKPGDRVFSFLTPSDEATSVKILNQNIGPNKNDGFIIARKDLFRKNFSKYLTELDQDYKQGIFKLRDDLSAEQIKEFETQLPVILGKINQELLTWLNDPSHGNYPDAKSYNITYGSYQVSENTNPDISNPVNNLLSAQKSLQLAQLNRGMELSAANKEFSPEIFNKQLEKLANLKTELQSFASITDKNGDSYQIFTANGQLNRDLIRLHRKNGLKVDEGDANKVLIKEKIAEYIKAINFIDFFKPYALDELSPNSENPGKFEELQARYNLAQKIKAYHSGDQNVRFESAELELLKKSINKENKDANFDSEVEFVSKSLEISDGTYLSLDIVDVGVDQILSYEQMANNFQANRLGVREGEKPFNPEKVLAGVGDEVTEKLRDVRARMKEVFTKHGLDNVNFLVGGDEFTISLPTDQVTDELLFDLRKAAEVFNGARLVRTDRQTDPGADLKTKQLEHARALIQSEQGIEESKLLEKRIAGFKQTFVTELLSKKEELEQKIGKKIEKDSEISDLVQRSIDESGINRFIIVQEKSGDVVKWPAEISFSGDSAEDLLDDWEAKTRASFADAEYLKKMHSI